MRAKPTKRPAAPGHADPVLAISGAKLGALMTLALLAGCADNPTAHSAAAFVGLATTPHQGPDFVQSERPANPEYTSVGAEPAHPPDKPRDKNGVTQLRTELEAQRDAGHAILATTDTQVPQRQGAPPAPDPRGVEAAKLKAQADTASKIAAAHKKAARKKRHEDQDKAPQ
jgi:hypothetical protein